MTPAQLKQMFEFAFYNSIPVALRALFGLFDSPAGVPNIYFPLSLEAQQALFKKLSATYSGVDDHRNYGPAMGHLVLVQHCWNCAARRPSAGLNADVSPLLAAGITEAEVQTWLQENFPTAA